MASNNWTSLPQRRKDPAKKKVLYELKDIFGSEYEDQVIMTIAQAYNYNLENTTNALLKISETKHRDKYDKSKSNYDPWRDEKLPWEEEKVSEIQNINCEDYKDIVEATAQLSMDNNRKHVEEKDKELQKVDTSSLCGLKIQYQPKNSRNQSVSVDDDADVVIENESQSSSNSSRSTSPEQATHSTNTISFPPSATEVTFSCSNLRTTPTFTQSKQMTDMSDSFHKRIMEPINNGHKILILMRGVPGCGKSFLARRIINQVQGATYNNHVFSADDYFMRSGVYKFDANNLTNAHSYCQNKAFQAMKEGRSPIIIDNTNTQFWEMQIYVTSAVNFGYIIETLEPETKWARKVSELERKNSHGVPKNKIEAMLKRYESNISGKDLLRGTRSTYHADCTPPQMRNLPPFPSSSAKVYSTPTDKQVSKSVPVAVSTPDFPKPSLPSLMNRRMRLPKLTAQVPALNENTLNIPSNNILNNVVQKDLENSTFKEDDLFKNNNMSETKVNSTSYEKSSINDTFTENYFLGETKVPCSTSNFDREENPEKVELERIYSIFTKLDDHNFKIVNEIPAIRLKPIISKISESNENVTHNANAVYNETNTVTDSLHITPTININKKLINIREETDNVISQEKIQHEVVTDTKTNESSDCKDFTVFINGMIMHSKYPYSDVSKDETNPSNEDDGLNQNESEIIDNNEKLMHNEERDEIIQTQVNNESSTNVKESEIIPDNTAEKIESPTQSDVLDNSSNKDSSFEFIGDNTSLFGIYDREDISDSEWMSIKKISTEELNKDDSPTLDQQSDKSEINAEHNSIFIPERTADPAFKNNIVLETDLFHIESKANYTRDFESDGNNIYGYQYFIDELVDASSTKSFDFINNKNLAEDKSREYEEINMQEVEKDIMGEEMKSSSNKFFGINNNKNGTEFNWSFPPFPMDGFVTPANLLPQERVENPCKNTVDSSTFTDPYDFNVAYFGGGIDGYKVLNAVNRNINDPLTPVKNQDNRIPLQYKLDKGTMTNKSSIIISGDMYNLEDETETEDRSAEIVKKFPQWPELVILNLYKEVFKGNFQNTCEYLIENLEGHNMNDYAECDDIIEDKTLSPSITPEQSSSRSTSPDSNETALKKKKGKKKKKKSVLTDNELAVSEALKSKFQMSQESYPVHTLKVKRWKNRQFDDSPLNSISAKSETSIVPGLGEDSNIVQSLVPEPLSAETSEKETRNSLDFHLDLNSNDEETIEINVGFEFIRQLENMFGGGEFDHDGIHPVIQMPKSMAQQLHSLWIETTNKQYTHLHHQLDLMIAKDAEYARTLTHENKEMTDEPEVPNLKEIMDMELALASYKSDKNKRKELPKQIKQRVTQNTLYEMFPDFDPKVIKDLYEAHGRDFDETFKVLEENSETTSRLTLANILKKRNNLIDELHKENSNATSQNISKEAEEASGGYNAEEENEEIMSYEQAYESARRSRLEAQRQFLLRNEYFQKARLEYKKKNALVASYYSDVAKLHTKNMERAHEEAVTAYLAAQLHSNNSNQIDLHNLRVTEAIQALEIFIDSQLEQMARGTRKEIFIITGKGTHSFNGQSKIKPAVAKELDKKKLSFSEMEYNAGMLRVVLKKL